MDLETLLTTVYVLIDDWYKQQQLDKREKKG